MCDSVIIHTGKKKDDFTFENSDVKSSPVIKGDIDELIFPDDEPCYISER